MCPEEISGLSIAPRLLTSADEAMRLSKGLPLQQGVPAGRDCKGNQQRRVEAGVQRGFAEQLVRGEHVRERQIVIHLRDDALHRHRKLPHALVRPDHDRARALPSGFQISLRLALRLSDGSSSRTVRHIDDTLWLQR